MLDKTPRNLLANNGSTPDWVLVPELAYGHGFNGFHCLGWHPPLSEIIAEFWPVSRRMAGILLAAALAFDPHTLVLSWTPALDERVPTTSADTCRAAIDAIIAGRWLADDRRPIAMRCERGSAFAPGWDCIAGFNCEARR